MALSPAIRRSRIPLRGSPSGLAGAVPSEVDVLIVGCGPAGLTLAAQLSAFPDIKTCIVEQKPGRCLRGQADGIACRTMEMFHAFGFAERVLKEACWINETTFWKPDENAARQHRAQRPGAGCRGRAVGISPRRSQSGARARFLSRRDAQIAGGSSRTMRGAWSTSRSTSPPATMRPTSVTRSLNASMPRMKDETETVKARYVVGCDGARSVVRKSIGRALQGDSANHAWGVMDVLAVTDFPDVRLKAADPVRQGRQHLIIPREGGYLFRLYVELDKLDARAGRRPQHHVGRSDRGGAAHPASVYARREGGCVVVGLRDRPAAVRQVRRCAGGGDRDSACRACSLPAMPATRTARRPGQGMNVSMQDGFNLGWKLAAVLRGRARRTCCTPIRRSVRPSPRS